MNGWAVGRSNGFVELKQILSYKGEKSENAKNHYHFSAFTTCTNNISHLNRVRHNFILLLWSSLELLYNCPILNSSLGTVLLWVSNQMSCVDLTKSKSTRCFSLLHAENIGIYRRSLNKNIYIHVPVAFLSTHLEKQMHSPWYCDVIFTVRFTVYFLLSFRKQHLSKWTRNEFEHRRDVEKKQYGGAMVSIVPSEFV